MISKVLERYPDVAPGSLHFPPESVEWTEKDIDLFVGSGGFLKPKRKPAVAAVAAPVPTRSAAPVSADGLGTSVSSTAPVAAGAASAPRAEVDLMECGTSCWRVPLISFMEDVGPRGLKMVAALNKCERSRSAALMRSAKFDLEVLKTQYGAGILLREFALEMVSDPPAGIMSVLWCETKVELPCAPFMPMVQHLVPESGELPVCSGRFNLLMLEVKTMEVLSNNSIYEEVARPLRQSLGIPKPTGKEGVPKFPRCYPSRGRPFRPSKLLKTECVIMPSDCDMYRVIFHPQVANVCERINFALGVEFQEERAVAIYANLAKPASVGDRFEVSVLVEPPGAEAVVKQHRVMYLFVLKGGSGASACVMTIFVVYGPAPGALTAEDVGACAASKFGSLYNFVAGTASAIPSDKEVDLLQCVRA